MAELTVVIVAALALGFAHLTQRRAERERESDRHAILSLTRDVVASCRLVMDENQRVREDRDRIVGDLCAVCDVGPRKIDLMMAGLERMAEAERLATQRLARESNAQRAVHDAVARDPIPTSHAFANGVTTLDGD